MSQGQGWWAFGRQSRVGVKLLSPGGVATGDRSGTVPVWSLRVFTFSVWAAGSRGAVRRPSPQAGLRPGLAAVSGLDSAGDP